MRLRRSARSASETAGTGKGRIAVLSAACVPPCSVAVAGVMVSSFWDAVDFLGRAATAAVTAPLTSRARRDRAEGAVDFGGVIVSLLSAAAEMHQDHRGQHPAMTGGRFPHRAGHPLSIHTGVPASSCLERNRSNRKDLAHVFA